VEDGKKVKGEGVLINFVVGADIKEMNGVVI